VGILSWTSVLFFLQCQVLLEEIDKTPIRGYPSTDCMRHPATHGRNHAENCGLISHSMQMALKMPLFPYMMNLEAEEELWNARVCTCNKYINEYSYNRGKMHE